jgi:membrane protein DedA with SNARE-associated domain
LGRLQGWRADFANVSDCTLLEQTLVVAPPKPFNTILFFVGFSSGRER